MRPLPVPRYHQFGDCSRRSRTPSRHTQTGNATHPVREGADVPEIVIDPVDECRLQPYLALPEHAPLRPCAPAWRLTATTALLPTCCPLPRLIGLVP